MKIGNYDTLATTPLRKAALEIAASGYDAIDTKSAVRANVRVEDGALRVRDRSYALSSFKRIFVAGVGKCAVEAAEALEEILGERIEAGAIVDVKTSDRLTRIRPYVGTHPLPSKPNVEAASHIVELLKSAEADDLVIFIVSGGGSTLLCLPEDAGCDEEAGIFTALTRQGASISEINTVRKHLSLARGGHLAKYIHPATGVALVFSDVPGDDLQFIASGPTVKDETTVEDAERILAKYDVLRVCGIDRCGLVETPKEDKYFEHIENVLVVSNAIALDRMAATAADLGYIPRILGSQLTGEAREVAVRVADQLHAAPTGTVLLAGGETTVTVTHPGKGGRNLEFALAALPHVAEGELILPFASDGHDNTDLAGAIADGVTLKHAAEQGLDPARSLAENASYDFFTRSGDYLSTGNTGSNVSDLLIGIKTK